MRLLVCLLASLGMAVWADDIRWLSTEYDFGSFKEAEGKKTGAVRFINTGTEPTAINRVKSTCGCTVASYSGGEIAPGDTATVSFTYNPAGRPGRFLKHLKVYTGTDNRLTSITLKGTVIGAPQTLAREYPVESGALRLSTDTLRMGHITKGASRNEFIHGYNQSADTLLLSWSDVPRGISLGVSSRNVAPGDIFTLSVYLNTADIGEPGKQTMRFNVINATPGEGERKIPFTVETYIDPDVSKFTPEQMKSAPVAMVYPTTVELGTVTAADKKIKVKISVINDGKDPLKITRVYSPQINITRKGGLPCTLKSGKIKEITVELDASLIPAGLFNIPVEVLTSDPLHPSRTVRLVGTRK